MFIQRELCSFITFFDVTVVTHMTVRDVRVICKTNYATTQDSLHKSASIAKLIVPDSSQTLMRSFKMAMQSFPKALLVSITTFQQGVTRKSCDSGCP